MRQPLVFEDGAHVGKVEVDERGVDDEVCDPADTLFEDLVRNAQRLDDGRILGNDAVDLVVRDNDERIDVFAQVFQTLDGVVHALFALEIEGLGNDGDREDLQIARDLRNDGRSAGARSAAHACGDEQKVGIFDRLGERILALFRGSPADLGLCPRAQPFCQRRTDLDLILRLGEKKDLLVGIDGDIARALDACLYHAVDRIAARAADTDDFDARHAGQIVQCIVVHVENYPPIVLKNL